MVFMPLGLWVGWKAFKWFMVFMAIALAAAIAMYAVAAAVALTVAWYVGLFLVGEIGAGVAMLKHETPEYNDWWRRHRTLYCPWESAAAHRSANWCRARRRAAKGLSQYQTLDATRTTTRPGRLQYAGRSIAAETQDRLSRCRFCDRSLQDPTGERCSACGRDQQGATPKG